MNTQIDEPFLVCLQCYCEFILGQYASHAYCPCCDSQFVQSPEIAKGSCKVISFPGVRNESPSIS